jgi:O-antigen ligase
VSYALPAFKSRKIPYDFLNAALFPLKVFYVLVSNPVALFLGALTAMLFRPPDLKTFPIDRVAFLVLVIVLLARFCIRRERLWVSSVTWPLLGLTLLGFWGALTQPYSSEAWSLFAARWAVPFVLFHFAGSIFSDDNALLSLELYLVIALGYLSIISVLSLFNASNLIFPRFIADESIGIHIDRARGPFLQAVANGMCLNLLGLVALGSYGRGRLRAPLALLLFVMVPLAMLATRTRAVWISAALSLVYLAFRAPSPRLRRASRAICLTGVVSALAFLAYHRNGDSFSERLGDRSPVEFRTEMYTAGWEMFTEKPLAGWGNEWQMQPEIEKRVSSFHPEYYVFHNTFLQLTVERGVIGLALYGWLIFCLFRLSGRTATGSRLPFLDAEFRKLWPLLIAVYVFNACAVVMNYQFVNALLFTIAGILASAETRGGTDVASTKECGA